MKLNLQTLAEHGGTAGKPVEKQITVHDAQGQEVTFTVYVRPMSFRTALSDIDRYGNKADAVAGRIASSICDENGQDVFTPEDVTGESDRVQGPLTHEMTMALLNVIGEVNGMGKTKAS